MKLIIGERAARLDVALGLVHSHHAVRERPLRGRLVFGGDPLVERAAVEQDDRVGWRRAKAGTGRHDPWYGLPDLGVLGPPSWSLLRRRADGECEAQGSACGDADVSSHFGLGVVDLRRLVYGKKYRG